MPVRSLVPFSGCSLLMIDDVIVFSTIDSLAGPGSDPRSGLFFLFLKIRLRRVPICARFGCSVYISSSDSDLQTQLFSALSL